MNIEVILDSIIIWLRITDTDKVVVLQHKSYW